VGSLETAAIEHLGQGTWLCSPLPQHERGGTCPVQKKERLQGSSIMVSQGEQKAEWKEERKYQKKKKE